MAIPAGVTRCSIVGRLGTSEEFNTSFWVLGGTDSQADMDALANGAADAFKTGMTDLQSINSPDCVFDKIVCYGYPAGGPIAGIQSEADIGIAGTASGSHLPLQCALVSTLLTGTPGRSNRGRMYWPAVGAIAGTDHQINGGTADAVNGDVVAFFAAVNAIPLAVGEPTVSVVSITRSEVNPVVEVKMDTRFDIQRRRANRQVATHTAAETF